MNKFFPIAFSISTTFLIALLLIEDFHLMLSPSGWKTFSQKVDDQKAMRKWSKTLVITPLTQNELGTICNCDIELVPDYIAKGVVVSSPMQDGDLEITLALHKSNVCGLVSANLINAANRGANYKWHGIPFTSQQCEKIKETLSPKSDR